MSEIEKNLAERVAVLEERIAQLEAIVAHSASRFTTAGAHGVRFGSPVTDKARVHRLGSVVAPAVNVVRAAPDEKKPAAAPAAQPQHRAFGTVVKG